MSYLLDTNVISETARPKPQAEVLEWLEGVPSAALHISVLTLGEIRRGVEGLPAGPRRERLRLWIEQVLTPWFEDRILPIDDTVADRWGRLTAAAKRPLAAVDSLIAATALTHDLRLVTRNTRDFALPELELVNPWKKTS